MAVVSPIFNRRTGRAADTIFKGYIEGGPELAAALANLEKSIRDELLKDVTLAGAEVIAAEWRARVQATWGQGPGSAHYIDAIEARSRAGKNGATARVGLGTVVTQPGEAQPRDYAPRLEFAGKPTLRPAFDGSRARALDVMVDRLRKMLGLN